MPIVVPPRTLPAALVWPLALLLAALVPSLLATSGEVPGAIGLVLVAALGGLLHRDRGRVLATGRPVALRAPRGSSADHPGLRARVTDPARHPLRPRAPGPV